MPRKKAAKKSSGKCVCGDNLLVHCWSYFISGLGVGVLLTNPVANPHPVRWGGLMVAIGVAMYFVSGGKK